MKYFRIVHGFMTIALFVQGLSAQYQNEEISIHFSSRIRNPVEINVSENSGKLLFTALNKSNYPYELTIHFKYLENLNPRISSRKSIIYPGTTNLFSLAVVDPQRSHQYEYSLKYTLGIANMKADSDFPYLIPAGKGELVDFQEIGEDKGILFNAGAGATVYAMRKGLVVAVPEMNEICERISSQPSIEILHDDGTVMVYDYIAPNSSNIRVGKTVFPGQPIGKVDSNGMLLVRLCQFSGEGMIITAPISYYTGNQVKASFASSDKIKVIYPREIITRELSKKQIKKYEKNELYE